MVGFKLLSEWICWSYCLGTWSNEVGLSFLFPYIPADSHHKMFLMGANGLERGFTSKPDLFSIRELLGEKKLNNG